MSAARALLVGASRPDPRLRLAQLVGAADDAAAMCGLLKGRGFPEAALNVSTGPDATLSQAKRQLLHLAAVTGADDLGVFYFSGHGYRVLDRNGDEPDDRWDECLVLADGLLPDDWWRDTFWPATQPGSRWVTCVDACYSATATRSVLPISATTLVSPRLSVRVGEGQRWRFGLAACADGQETLETPAARAKPGAARGAMTRSIIDALDHSPAISYTQLWTAVKTSTTRLRRTYDWLGVPQIWASGPDDTLQSSPAFYYP